MLLVSQSVPHINVCFISMQVNIIPIIAKADTVSKSELDKLKIKIMSELVSNGVQIYQFPTEDEAVAEINTSMNVSPRNTQTQIIHNTILYIFYKVIYSLNFSTTVFLSQHPSLGIVALIGSNFLSLV